MNKPVSDIIIKNVNNKIMKRGVFIQQNVMIPSSIDNIISFNGWNILVSQQVFP